MRPCPQCSFSCAPEATECPSCGIIFARWRPPAQRLHPGVSPVAAPAPRVERNIPWRAIVVGLVVVGALGWWLRPRWFPLEAMQPANAAEPAPCEGVSRCVVVYVAPWCGACKASLPVIQEIGRALGESGQGAVAVVVGLDSPDKMRAMAKTVGPGAFLDESGEIRRRMGVEAVPEWFTLNASGRILHQSTGTVPIAQLQMERLELR